MSSAAKKTMRVADYIMAAVAAAGVKHVFLLPGGGAMHLVDALGLNPDLTFVPNHHEQASVIAAEAYGRVAENLGVALVTTGPGATNAITGVTGAWIESTPLLVISGQVKRADRIGDRGVRQMGVQEVDIVSLVEPITKYAVTVDDPYQIRVHMDKALYLARHGRQGPVWIDVPLDVQASQIDPDTLPGWTPPTEEADTRAARAGAEQLLAMLTTAQRPLLIVGHGIRLSGAAKDFQPLVEKFGIPVVSTWNAMDLLPFDHPLTVGKAGGVALRAANFAIQNCDLLIAVGARLDHVITAYNPRNFARAATKLVVDIDPAELNKLDMPDLTPVVADAKDFLSALNELAQPKRFPEWSSWRERCQSWKQRYPVLDGDAFPATGPISHYRLADALSNAVPENMLFVTGSSGLGVEAFYTVFRNKPGQRLFLTSGLGAMGYGLPAAIGACTANGKRKTALIESDGSLQLNVQELATIAGQKLPLIIFIMNNQGYASIRNTQRNYFESRFVATGPEGGLNMPDIRALANAYGIPSMTIETSEALDAGLREALAQPGPFLCEVKLIADETLWPKVAALPQPDGSMLSMPLEDMSPLLSLEQLQEEMLIPLHPASLAARR
ncbi:MAG TPA: thiamine pyrophosphate-binding protein [Rhodocyclaceae bacterium]|nr:thiamine pyrophosphate-binding protein [Rhodocyclaceae bacterium]